MITEEGIKLKFDIEKVRADFPILQQEINNTPLVYLDNAATSQKPQSVIDAIANYYKESNANVHRALHTLAERATTGYENTRKKVKLLINARDENEIIFTKGTTEAINMIAHSWAEHNIADGSEIILSEMEHHSNIVPWHLLAQRKNITLKFISVTEKGELDLDQFQKLLSKKTALVSIMHISNVLGTVNPVEQIVKIAQKYDCPVLIDGAQAVPNSAVDVQQIDCDFYAFSSHKMLGPTGIGVLYVKKNVLDKMQPFLGGGEMISTVSKEGSTWAELPHKFEAGTPNIAAAFGLSAAIDYLLNIGMNEIEAYKSELTSYALEKMNEIESLTVLGKAQKRSSALSFIVKDAHPFDMAQLLDQYGIAIRSGHHCAQPLMKKLGISASARASLYFYNTKEEIDFFIEKLQRVIKLLTV